MSLYSYIIGPTLITLHKVLSVKCLAINIGFATDITKMNLGSFARILALALISLPTNVAYSSLSMVLSMFSPQCFHSLGYIYLVVWP